MFKARSGSRKTSPEESMTYEEKQRRRQRNAEIFRDTERCCIEIAFLSDAIAKTAAARLLIPEGAPIPGALPPMRAKPARVAVSARRSFEAAARYAGTKTCVLNFASATGPGGGVIRGSSAQEESLCRCSTLYPSLISERLWNGFYAPHRAAGSTLYNDDIIYSPGIVVFKSDDDAPRIMPRENWFTVDVLTCAAPNLRHFAEDDPERAQRFMHGGELLCILEKRAERIFEVALRQGAETLILGAFGLRRVPQPARRRRRLPQGV